MTINWQPNDLFNGLVKLTPITGKDFEALLDVASDPLIWEQHPEKDRFKREVFQKFFDLAVVSRSALLITDLKTGEIIGSTRFYDFNEYDRSVAIGYTFLARKYWGGLYNRSVKKLLLDYAFSHVDKVYFHIGTDNLRSQKAVRKLGALEDKVIEFDHYGQKKEHIQFVLKKNDWEKG